MKRIHASVLELARQVTLRYYHGHQPIDTTVRVLEDDHKAGRLIDPLTSALLIAIWYSDIFPGRNYNDPNLFFTESFVAFAITYVSSGHFYPS